MLEGILQSHDVGIHFETDDARLHKYFRSGDMARNHIPDFSMSGTQATWSLIHRTRPAQSLEWIKDYRELVVEGRFGTNTSQHDFTFLLLTLFSYLHEERGRSIIHSSAVSKGESARLIVAGRGGGKSLLATELVYKREYSLISGENTLVDGTAAIGGTRAIRNRLPCVNDRYPELLDYDFSERTNYDTKVEVPRECIDQSKPSAGPIGSVYLVHVDDAFSQLYVAQAPRHGALYDLFGNASAYIAGLGHSALNFMVPHASLDTPELRQNRLDRIKGLIDGVGVIELRGNVDQVADYIQQDEREK